MPSSIAASTSDHDARKRPIAEAEGAPAAKKTKLTVKQPEDGLEGTVFNSYIRGVEILVGPSQTPIFIHRDELQEGWPRYEEQTVEVRREARDPPRSSIETRTPKLAGPHLTAETFQTFATWLYTRVLAPLPPGLTNGMGEEEAEQYQDPHRLVPGRVVDEGRDPTAQDSYAFFTDIALVRLFEFAVAIDNVALSNQVITTFALQNAHHQRTTARGAVLAAYQSPHAASRLTDCIAEDAMRRLTAATVRDDIHTYSPKFVGRVLSELLRQRDSSLRQASNAEWLQGLCQFHCHTDPDTPTCNDSTVEMAFYCWSDSQLHLEHASTVRILVGPSRTEFVVHEILLCKESSFFRSAFLASFAEGQQKRLVLEEESVGTFALVMYWLYNDVFKVPDAVDHRAYRRYEDLTSEAEATHLSGLPGRGARKPRMLLPAALNETTQAPRTIKPDPALEIKSEHTEEQPISAVPSSAADSRDAPHGSTSTAESPSPDSELPAALRQRKLDVFTDLYIFADRRGMPRLRNEIMNKIIGKREAGAPLVASVGRINKAWASLAPNSRLIHYLVDEAAYCWSSTDVKQLKILAHLPPEFVIRVMQVMVTYSRKAKPVMPRWRRNPCIYHDHDDPAERMRCAERHTDWYKSLKEKGAAMEPVKKD